MEGWEEYQWDPNEQILENRKKENAKMQQMLMDLKYDSLKRDYNISPKIFQDFSKNKIIEVVDVIIEERRRKVEEKIQALFPRQKKMTFRERKLRKFNILRERHREENQISLKIIYQDFIDFQ